MDEGGAEGPRDAPAAPAGWYPDPDNPRAQRYWDGAAWAPPPPPPPPAEAPETRLFDRYPPGVEPRSEAFERLARQPSTFWFGALAAVLMVVGALGTWATALGVVSVAGTRGEDGWFVVGAGVVGLVALWSRMLHNSVAPAVIAVLCGVAGGLVSGIDLHKLASVGTTNFLGTQLRLVHPEWGIYLALGASVALVGFALALSVTRPRSAGSAALNTAIVLVAVGTVVAISQIGVEHGQAATSEGEGSPASSSTQNTEASTSTTSAPTSITSEDVQPLLKRYEAAYSSKSVTQLEGLFVPSFTRHNGTHAAENREEALATYRMQFSQLQSPMYSLSNVQINAGTGEATASASYSITSQNGTVGGIIAFHVVPNGSGLGIDQITIHPRP
jgi:Protein of unknown function (DUF2510)